MQCQNTCKRLISRFFENTKSLGKKSHTTMLDKESSAQGFLEEQRLKTVNYIQNVLKDRSHPREDYKESLQLSLLFQLPGLKTTSVSGSSKVVDGKGNMHTIIDLFTKQLNTPQT